MQVGTGKAEPNGEPTNLNRFSCHLARFFANANLINSISFGIMAGLTEPNQMEPLVKLIWQQMAPFLPYLAYIDQSKERLNGLKRNHLFYHYKLPSSIKVLTIFSRIKILKL